MRQLYLIAILLSILAGILLSEKTFEKIKKLWNQIIRWLRGRMSVPMGIITVLIGVIYLLQPGKYVLVDNLLPSLALIISGISIILVFFTEKEVKLPEWLESSAVWVSRKKEIIGMAAVIIGILHALFPGTILI